MTVAERKAIRYGKYYGMRSGLYGLCLAESEWVKAIAPKYQPLALATFERAAVRFAVQH